MHLLDGKVDRSEIEDAFDAFRIGKTTMYLGNNVKSS